MKSDHYAHLRVGLCDIAVPVAAVECALAQPAAGVTPLPRRDGALAGLLELAGSAIPVVALERWVALGEGSGDPAEARVVVLRDGASRIAICVDALVGVTRVDPMAVRPVCHTNDAEELFEAVVPATAARPLLCVLEVARLMALSAAWCEQAELEPAPVARSKVSVHGAATTPFALFVVGDQNWAVPAGAVRQLMKTPRADLGWPGQRVAGIGPWGTRKLPFVDLGAQRATVSSERPWMAILVAGPLAIGLVVSRFQRMVKLEQVHIVNGSGEAALAGTSAVPGMGMVSFLNVEGLFREITEASISLEPDRAARPLAPAAGSRVTNASNASSATNGTKATTNASNPLNVAAAADTGRAAARPDEASHYLVFEADRTYASPVAGVLGVAALPPETIDDLARGSPATLVWRGQTLAVVSMPSLDGGQAMSQPRFAVILKRPGDAQAHSAVAVRTLRNWISARAAQRSDLRQRDVGEMSMVTPAGGPRSTSLVVVDLAQMAGLLE